MNFWLRKESEKEILIDKESQMRVEGEDTFLIEFVSTHWPADGVWVRVDWNLLVVSTSTMIL